MDVRAPSGVNLEIVCGKTEGRAGYVFKTGGEARRRQEAHCGSLASGYSLLIAGNRLYSLVKSVGVLSSRFSGPK